MKYITIAILILSLFLITSCTNTADKINKHRESDWSVMQSPITGRYYEIFTKNLGYNSAMLTMSEITEEEYNKYIKSQDVEEK